jgi:prepilin-type N-terminal cleavage/methylation domain-containing protein
MTNNLPPRVVRHRGLTLLELTVVLIILLALVSIMSVGARAWLRGSERTSCILTLRNVQVAARSYQNLYGYNYGGRPYAERGTQDIVEHLRNKGYIEESTYKQSRGTTPCAAGGTYTCPKPDIFPLEGELYMNCSLSESANHVPSSLDGW